MIRRRIFEEEHDIFRDSFRKWLQEHYAPHAERYREQGVVDRELWLEAGKAGYLAMFVDENLTHICTEVFSVGGRAEAFVDVEAIMRRARSHNARYLWIAHNHPSDRLLPSGADKEVTDAFEAACKHGNVRFVDHLICSKEDYYSFKMGRSTRDPVPVTSQQSQTWMR